MQKRLSQFKRNISSGEKKAVPIFEIHVVIISGSCFTFPGYIITNKYNVVCQLNGLKHCIPGKSILGDPGADKGAGEKSKRAEKYTFLRAIFFRPFRLSLVPNYLRLGDPGSPRMRQISTTIKTPTPSPTVYFGTN